MKFNITVGCDPELFGEKDGKMVSVHDLIPGSKWEPFSVPHGAIQVDGVAAEFNIQPASTRRQFRNNIRQVMTVLRARLETSGVELIAVPTATFDKDYFDALPDEVKELGCEPDYNAYTGKPNKKPSTALPFRTGSGHVHVGWTDGLLPFEEKHFDECMNLVKELDFILYRSSKVWDTDKKRRLLYGKPGAFRPKPYGVEYRVLSNRWLAQHETTDFVFDATQAMSHLFFKGQRPSHGFDPSSSFDEYCAYLSQCKLPSVLDYGITPA